jgi:hypothetical protein
MIFPWLKLPQRNTTDEHSKAKATRERGDAEREILTVPVTVSPRRLSMRAARALQWPVGLLLQSTSYKEKTNERRERSSNHLQ